MFAKPSDVNYTSEMPQILLDLDSGCLHHVRGDILRVQESFLHHRILAVFSFMGSVIPPYINYCAARSWSYNGPLVKTL